MSVSAWALGCRIDEPSVCGARSALYVNGAAEGPSWAWNWLDIFVVTSSWIELAVDIVSPDHETMGANSNLRIMRCSAQPNLTSQGKRSGRETFGGIMTACPTF